MLSVPFTELSSRLRTILEEHGCAIVTDVIPSDSELEALEDDFKKDLLELINVKALDSAPQGVRDAFLRFESKGPRGFPLQTALLLTTLAGSCLDRCLCHGRFAWRVRRHPNVHAVYRELFEGCEDLVTSMSATFFTPGGQEPANTNVFAAHVDQNSNDVRHDLAECNSYQGVLYVWPATADGDCSTTVVWPGSHLDVFPRMMRDEQFAKDGKDGFHHSAISNMKDFGAAAQLASAWAEEGRRAIVPRGSLLLWNSRTVHCGWTGGPRLAQTVCLEPAERRPEAEYVAKLRLAALGLPSCHWASVAMEHELCLGHLGVFSQDQVPFHDTETDDLDEVILPLRPALRPAAVRDGVFLGDVLGLVDVDYRLPGMWDPPEGSGPLLEEKVRAEFKRYL